VLKATENSPKNILVQVERWQTSVAKKLDEKRRKVEVSVGSDRSYCTL